MTPEELAAYPRCEACGWWDPPSPRGTSTIGECHANDPGILALKRSRGDASAVVRAVVLAVDARLVTAHDYGCVQWKAAEQEKEKRT